MATSESSQSSLAFPTSRIKKCFAVNQRDHNEDHEQD